jgi:hypothetical protein
MRSECLWRLDSGSISATAFRDGNRMYEEDWYNGGRRGWLGSSNIGTQL